MSQISALILEALKHGELSLVAEKMEDLKTEIETVLTALNSLTTEVQGNTTNPVGVIHSPARRNNVNKSIEMFIGQYQVGDITDSVNSKQGSFLFGASSECKFYFMPSDPLHGVNKKYVDQVVSPISNQLGNMINRYGDRVPVNQDPGTIGSCTYIFTMGQDQTEKVRWLLDGRSSSYESDFNAFNSGLSLFWLNVDDARYFGSTVNDSNIANMGAIRKDFLSRTGTKDITKLSGTSSSVEDAGILFERSICHFDSQSKPTWSGSASDPDDLVTKKDLPAMPVIPNAISTACFNTQSYHMYGTPVSLMLSLARLTYNRGLISNYFNYDSSNNSNSLRCIKDCSVMIFSNAFARTGSGKDKSIDQTLTVYKNGAPIGYSNHSSWDSSASNNSNKASGYVGVNTASDFKANDLLSVSLEGTQGGMIEQSGTSTVIIIF